jgi:hypothetical protein
MSLALETICDALRLSLTDDPNTRLLAQRGVQDAATKRDDAEKVQALLMPQSAAPHLW